MKLISLLFLLTLTKLINSCTLNCNEFLNSGRYHADCAFSTIGNATSCSLDNFNQELIDAGITQRISVVNLLFDFSPHVTRVYLKLVSTPSQKLIVQAEKHHFTVKTLYLVGRFEFPDQSFWGRFPNVQLLVFQTAYFPNGIPSFNELRYLTHLYSDRTEIGGNNLVLSENFIGGLPDLDHVLFRTENTDKITIASANVFSQLSILTYLNLKRVSFSDVPLEVLKPLVSLKILRISSAFISNLTFLENSGLTNVEEINFAFNRINTLRPFGYFPKLTELALYSNEVSFFDKEDLRGLKRLVKLDLDSNRIGYLSTDIFSELRDLQSLKLLRNNLKTLSPQHIQHLRHLNYVDLRLNNLLCDCSLAWIANVSTQYSIEFRGECTDYNTNDRKVITEQSSYAGCSETFFLQCFNRSNTCRENSHCVGNANNFSCPCNNGFNDANGSCVDIDECASGIAKCEYHCSNLPGSYECCLPGFRVSSGGRCVDLNECVDSSTNDCLDRCVNTVGSYACACNEGYELNSDGKSCSDIDECSDSDQGCSYLCKNEVGSFYCECPAGYQLVRDGKRCIDNSSCHYLHSGCERYCEVNTGEFECVCDAGFQHETIGNLQRCANVNECEIPQICSEACVDIIGSYLCLCDPGSRLEFDNKTCVDIDECEEGTHNCRALEYCVNTENSFDCVCLHGHTIEGTYQCGFLPIYAYYVTGGVFLVIAIPVILIVCVLCCVFLYKRKQKRKERRRAKKLIYKEVSLQRTARHHGAFDPLNLLENVESSTTHISVCDTPDTDRYMKMFPSNDADNLYDSINVVVADDGDAAS